MTTDLTKTFFDTFGIEPTHEDACKLADKYWGNEELAEKYYVFDRYIEKNCPIGGKECFSTCKYAYDNIEYPQITDRILLELICVHNTYLEANLYSLDYESLGKEILEDLIEEQESRELKKDYVSDDMKQQVQALFKEE